MSLPNIYNGSLISRFSEVRLCPYVMLFRPPNPNSDPPIGSLSSSVDLLGGMSTIRQRAASNLYKSQYAFDQDINNLLNSANDGHLALIPCSFAIDFVNTDAALVSLSTDGVSLPKLHTLGAYIASCHIQKR